MPPWRWSRLSGTPTRTSPSTTTAPRRCGRRAAPPVHSDPHAVVLKDLGELPAAELATLVGVEHLGPSLFQRLNQGLGAKAGFQSVGQPPDHHVAAVPVHYGHHVEKSPGHGQIGDVGGPRLVEPGDPGVLQQVGIDPMLRRSQVGKVAQFWRYLSRSAGCRR